LNKTALRILAVALAATLLLTILAGCSNEADMGFETPEFVFLPDIVDLPEGIPEIRDLAYSDGVLYFWANVLIDEENWEYIIKLYSINIDGTNFMELPNYEEVAPPFEDASGSFYISSLIMDDDHIWVVESGQFFRFDLPDDFDGDDMDRWEHYEDLGNVVNVRKLDKTGAEVLSIDISSLSAGREWFFINAFAVDAKGNIYIGSDSTIFILNNEGDQQFRLEVEDWIRQLIRLPNGIVGHFGWSNTEMSNILRTIDFSTRGWGESIPIPQDAWDVYPGSGDYSLLFRNNNNLYGIEAETGDPVKLLNWLDSNIAADQLENISILPDGRIICTNTRWSQTTHEQQFELFILTRFPYSELPERIVLTLAAVWLDWNLRPLVVQFNRTNPTYRIQVIDYSEFNTDDDWSAGLTRLSTDLIAGKVPDMLDLSGLPTFKQFVARGLIEDLYTFIDSDPEISRSDLMESVFRAAEMDGGLYRLFPSFSINTLVGHPSVVGPGMGWTMDEFMAVLNANPQADMPMGQWLTKSSFLQNAIQLNMDEYVDWAAGESHFDTSAFIQLLEFANRFPADFDYGNDFGMDYIEEHELIAQGRQIMANVNLNNFETIQIYRAMFGGDVVFKGFPTASGSGNSLSIWSGLSMTTRSSHPEGVWEFMRSIISTNWQRENVNTWNFPTNRIIFDERAREAMEEQEIDHTWGWGRDFEVEIAPVTQAEVDLVHLIIDTAFGIASYDEALMNIINENTEDFFNGRTSAQDTARIIQSRVSRLISEQS